METSGEGLITRDRIIRFFTVLLGSFIYAVAVNMFITPHRLIAGGVAGIGIILQYITKLSSGYFVFLVNVPLFIIGIKKLDREFGFYSLVGMLSMSGFLILTKDVTKYYVMKDIMLSCICGGFFCGVGMGIIFRSRASEGGTDIICVIVKRHYGMKISSVAFIINVMIVCTGAFLGSVEVAVYTIISMYVKSKTLDYVVDGLDRKKMILVVTEKTEEIKGAILEKLGRGVTFLHGEGAYTGSQKEVIYSVMNSKQLARCKMLINNIDPKAVMTIMDVSEVEGKGFKKSAFQ